MLLVEHFRMLRLPGSAGEAMVSIIELVETSSGNEGNDNATANCSDLFIIRNR